MIKSLSHRVWEYARGNVSGLLPCPTWMTEGQYASMCFESNCHGCSTGDVGFSGNIWEYGVRTTVDNFMRKFPDGDYLNDFYRKPAAVLPLVSLMMPLGSQVELFHTMDAAKLLDRIAHTSSDQSRHNLLSQSQAVTTEIYQSSSEYYAWHERVIKAQQKEKAEILRIRHIEIMERLEQEGFENELHSLGLQYQGLTQAIRVLIERPQMLTEPDVLSEWIQIYPEIRTFLLQRRILHERLRRRNILAARLDIFRRALQQWKRRVCLTEGPIPLPRPMDLASYEELRSIIIDIDSPLDYFGTQFATVLPGLTQRWQKERRLALLTLWFTGSGFTDSSLSTTCGTVHHFFCTVCGTIDVLGEAMVHLCCYGTDTSGWDQTMNDMAWFDGVIPSINGELYDNACVVAFQGRLKWVPSPLRSCKDIVHAFLKLPPRSLMKCDQSSLLATLSRTRLACGHCGMQGAVMLVMGWKQGILHAHKRHAGKVESWFELPKRLQEVIQHEEQCSHDQLRFNHFVPVRTQVPYMKMNQNLAGCTMSYTFGLATCLVQVSWWFFGNSVYEEGHKRSRMVKFVKGRMVSGAHLMGR
ncbi:hypothetical protein C8Q74DRAFT_1391754 [Fomes fomentarius]|nr:hypothetical protein C8Q74DRAFT_1391754 [Fomes fomentarius]